MKKGDEVEPIEQKKLGRKRIELDSFAEGVVRRTVILMYHNK